MGERITKLSGSWAFDSNAVLLKLIFVNFRNLQKENLKIKWNRTLNFYYTFQKKEAKGARDEIPDQEESQQRKDEPKLLHLYVLHLKTKSTEEAFHS